MEDEIQDLSDTEEIEFAGGFFGGYSDPQEGLDDLSGATASIGGILAGLSLIPGGSAIVEKVGPMLKQVQDIANMILGMNRGLETLQTKVITDLSNTMSAAVNSAVTASTDATNKILIGAGIPVVARRKFTVGEGGVILDEEGNEVAPAGSTIDPGGNVLDADGNVLIPATDPSLSPGASGKNANANAPPASPGNAGNAGNTPPGNAANAGNAGNVPAENVPSENVPSENVPAENVPAGNVPAENVPAGNVPSENAPPANNSAGGGRRKTVKWRSHLTRRKRR